MRTALALALVVRGCALGPVAPDAGTPEPTEDAAIPWAPSGPLVLAELAPPGADPPPPAARASEDAPPLALATDEPAIARAAVIEIARPLTDEDRCAGERAAVLRALGRWCRDPRTTVARAYYDDSLDETKAQACRALRRGIARCELADWGGDGWWVEFPYASAWHLAALADGDGWRVVEVDFEEDCTGP